MLRFLIYFSIFLVNEIPISKIEITIIIKIFPVGEVAGIGNGVGVGLKTAILRSSIYQPLKLLFSASTVSNRNLIFAGPVT